MQKNLKNVATNERVAVHVLCIKIETKKCKNDVRIDRGYKSAKMTQRGNPVISFLQNFIR